MFLFNGPFAGSTLTLVVRDIQFLTGTIAIVYLDTSLTGYAFLPPGLPSSGGVQRNRSTWVVEKRGGSGGSSCSSIGRSSEHIGARPVSAGTSAAVRRSWGLNADR